MAVRWPQCKSWLAGPKPPSQSGTRDNVRGDLTSRWDKSGVKTERALKSGENENMTTAERIEHTENSPCPTFSRWIGRIVPRQWIRGRRSNLIQRAYPFNRRSLPHYINCARIVLALTMDLTLRQDTGVTSQIRTDSWVLNGSHPSPPIECQFAGVIHCGAYTKFSSYLVRVGAGRDQTF